MSLGVALALACSKPLSQSGDVFADVQRTAPVSTVDAKQLTAAYDDNALEAEGKYTSKVVEVTGQFLGNQKVTADAGEVWYATLDGVVPRGMRTSDFVHCYFNASDAPERERFASLTRGVTIRVKGKVSAKPFEVELHGCTML
jgi:hypothetical protein